MNKTAYQFFTKQHYKSAVFWAAIIVAYVAAKAIGYAKLYPTLESRVKIASSFSSNIGLSAILGKPNNIETIAGYTAWNTIGVVLILVSIWSIFLTTKSMRGEEEKGRLELILSGATTKFGTCLSQISSILTIIFLQFVILVIGYNIISQNKALNFGFVNNLYFGLVTVSGALLFFSIAALFSQIMPTRSKATAYSIGTFGIFLVIRAAADITSVHWLSYLTPLGWVEKTQPLYSPQPQWLIPIGLLSLICLSATLWLASKRDLGSSMIKDQDTKKANNRFLGNVFLSETRLNFSNLLAWLAGITLISLFYGMLTKSAATALNQVLKNYKLGRILHTASLNSTLVFLSIAFLIYMLILMSFTASMVSRMRSQEASGLLDNIFVRPVSRMKWLLSRCVINIMAFCLLALVASLATYLAAKVQGADITLHDLLLAAVNILPVLLFTYSFGLLALAFIPRLTSVAVYLLIGWSFLVNMLSSGLNLNHWIKDTSLINHVSLAPSVPIDWTPNEVFMGLSLVIILVSFYRFNHRDLVAE